MINIKEFYENFRSIAKSFGSISRKSIGVSLVPDDIKDLVGVTIKSYYTKEKIAVSLADEIFQKADYKLVRKYSHHHDETARKLKRGDWLDDIAIYIPRASNNVESDVIIFIASSSTEFECYVIHTIEKTDEIKVILDEVNVEVLKQIDEVGKRKNAYDGRVNLLITTQSGADKIKSPTKTVIDIPDGTEITDLYPNISKEKFEQFFDPSYDGKKGRLFFIYGPPGTGKTSLFKSHYLMDIIKDQEVTFLSPSALIKVFQPDMMSFAINNLKNNILFVEDAEEILYSREADGNTAMSTLLNITDGIISEILNAKVVCTFNTDINKLDKAILRKGRLYHKEEIGFLSKSDARNLCSKINSDFVIDSNETTLAEIIHYNSAENDQPMNTKKRSIGFS